VAQGTPAKPCYQLALSDGLSPTPAPDGTLERSVADELGRPDRSDKLLEPVVVEVDRGALIVGFSDGTNAVLLVPDRLALRQDLHNGLLLRRTHLPGSVENWHSGLDGDNFTPPLGTLNCLRDPERVRLTAPSWVQARRLAVNPSLGQGLEADYILGLQAFRSLLDLEFNRLAFI
jgi:hypothetical protein